MCLSRRIHDRPKLGLVIEGTFNPAKLNYGRDSRTVDSDKHHVAAEIAEAVTGGLDDEWHLIAVELRNFRAQYSPATGASIYKEFVIAADCILLSIKRRFTRFLEICRDRYVRPYEVIEPTVNALLGLIQQLRGYGQMRIADAAAFGLDKLVSAPHEQAIKAAEGSLTQAYLLALQGIAGSTVIFEQAEWPPKATANVQEAEETAETGHERINASDGASGSDTFDQPTPTAGSHRKATQLLGRWLKYNEHATKREALDFLRNAQIPVSATGFNQRVWPEARKLADLSEKAPPGQKPRWSEATKSVFKKA